MMRTHNCGELTKKSIGKKVTLCGWVHTRRDHGGVIFIDLRDRFGLTQIVFDPSFNKKVHKEANSLRREFVLKVSGIVKSRKKGMRNPKLKTGDIEVFINEFDVLSKSKVPPIEIEDRIESNEELRLKYRYLDLRRPIMQKHLLIRHEAAKAAREFFDKNGFLEIETPLLVRATPEGARDYIVPSRVNPGKFYALPQSPQLYKQILMISGCDRYYQIARCLRDEDLRSDRQPEHTQMDFEMSFVTEKDIMDFVEGLYKYIFKKVLKKDVKGKFPVLSYKESMEKYGTDKPDLRYGLELINITEIAKKSDFNILKEAECVKCINVEKSKLSRKDIDDLVDFCIKFGAKGLSWLKFEKKLEGSVVKFFSDKLQKELIKKVKAKKGSLLLFIADDERKVNEFMNLLRRELARRLDLIKKDEFNFCWVIDFPLFEWNEDENRWEPAHHMFSMPKEESLKYLEKDPGKVVANIFDIILNGVELGSGSIRISNPDIQERVMKVIGLSKQEAYRRFGFLLKAYEYGGPVHGGMGLGFDRLVAILCGEDDIREVIAFPKNKAAQCPMDGSPSDVGDEQLKDLHVKLDVVKKK